MKNKEWHQFLGFLSTPPLWKKSSVFRLKQFSIPEISFQNPPDLLSELPSLHTNYVLGKRIERFYSLVLNRSVNYNLLAQSLQIFRDKLTLGELDFILEGTAKKNIIHLEVVFKFYIYDPSLKGELERWIGPNRRDTLLRKLVKLEQKQLPLLYREETGKELEKLGIKNNNVEQKVSFLAQLFVPRDSLQKEFLYVNNDCVAGTWIHFDEFIEEDFGVQEFFIPLKQDWPADPSFHTNWYYYKDIFPDIEKTVKRERSPLIWMRLPTGKFERFFIVWW